MAKYYVSATRKSSGKITALKVHPTSPDGSFLESNFTIMSHDDMARFILAANEYWTIVRNHDRTWRKGAKVDVVPRTDQNGSSTDNLDNLPDC